MAEKSTIVLITGCSSGIGLELLKRFDKPGYLTVGTALPDSLESLRKEDVAQSPRIGIEALDVSDFAQATSVVRKVEAEHGPIDILINNAGISYRAVVEDMTPEDEQRQMQVNYFGPMHLIREVLPGMRQRRSGRIINVSSVGGMMAMPTMASYSASKFALEGASESLWYELRPWNIHITLVRPGFINSLAFKKVFYSKKHKERQSDPYHAHYTNMTRFIENVMQRTPCTSENVARRIYQIAQAKRPPLRASGTPDARIFYYFRRLIPRFLYHKLLYKTLPGIKTWGNIISTTKDTEPRR